MYACLIFIIIAQRYEKYNVFFVSFPSTEENWADHLAEMDKNRCSQAKHFSGSEGNHSRFSVV